MKIYAACFFILFFSVFLVKVCAQCKFDFNQHSFKLLTFDISKSYYPLGGTGFVIKKDDNYYLISALHLFSKDTLYKDAWRMIPTLALSKKDLVIQKYNKPWVMIHNEELLQYNQSDVNIKYHWILIDSTKALDLGVLKLRSPEKDITDFAIPFDQLDADTEVTNVDGLVSGFPGRSDSTFVFETHLNSSTSTPDKIYFFEISCPPNLEGMSGSPVYTSVKSDQPKIKGVFVGQTTYRNKYYGTVLFAKYVRDLILQIE